MSMFRAVVSSGDLWPGSKPAAVFPHAWTDAGVAVETEFTGAHLYHLSAAGCVLNDLYREAQELGVDLEGVRVTADGDFNRESWSSTGVTYTVEVSSAADEEAIDRLLAVVDQVAEIPKALRQGAEVHRGEVD